MTPPRAAASGQGEPSISPHWLRWFSIYVRGYLARHFHGVHLSKQSAILAPGDSPLIVYLNHASWWDPLVCIHLGRALFPDRPMFAPMEQQQLERYGVFRKLGIFGVEPGTRRGAAAFLRAGERVLENPAAMLWLTPQARFADSRERPLGFGGGLAALARRVPHALLVPLAIEYVFWNERTPEVLVRFGPAESAKDLVVQVDDDEALSRHLEDSLGHTMDGLREEAIGRQPTDFDCLLRGKVGVMPAYDVWRRIKARLRGEEYRAEHGFPSLR